MAGYTRQSTADIIPTATVRAAPINAEYNALRDAFAASGGHKHDGTTGEGEYVPLIADLDALNKIQVDTNNNRFGVFVEVGAAAVEQVRFQDGVIVPVTDNDIDLGTSALEFKNLYLDGTAKIDTLTVDENATIAGTLGVTSNTTLGGTLGVTGATTLSSTLGVTGNTTLGGTLGVTGATTLSSTLAVTGSATLSSTLSVSSNATVGGTLAVTGTTSSTGDFSVNTDKFTVAATTGNTAVAGTLGVTGNTTLSGTLGVTGATTLSSTAAISGNTTIGGTLGVTGTTTYSTLTGSNLTATGTINFAGATVSNLGTVTTAAIGGGTINNTVIGGSTPAAITGTTITATSFVGPVTGNVTGNLTGNVTGNITGDVTGDLTGNVTASTGTSTFNNVTVNGNLNMDATSAATITNLTAPTNDLDAATKKYVDDEINTLIGGAPGTLDTLNEIAAAINDDSNVYTTLTNSIATKLPLAGGTMTGAINMGGSKITNAADPTSAQDLATKNYIDTTYVDYSSAGDAATDARKLATNAEDVQYTLADGTTTGYSALHYAAKAAASYDSFDDRYLGSKASDPTLDNDGNALLTGALYFDSTNSVMKVYNGTEWANASSSVEGVKANFYYTATSGQTVFSGADDNASTLVVDSVGLVNVYMNGVRLHEDDYTVSAAGDSVTLATGAATGDLIYLEVFGNFTGQSGAEVAITGGSITGLSTLGVTGTTTFGGNITFGDNDKAIFGAGSDLQIYHDGANSFIDENGAGNFFLRSVNGASIRLYSGGTASSNLRLLANSGGEITLYHSGSAKLATTSTGVDVTGTVTADGLTVDGASDLNGTITVGTTYTTDITGNDISFFRNNGASYIQQRGGHALLFRTNDGSDRTRLSLESNGDISFYEDTGTTPKFFWDASAERLGIGTSTPTYGTVEISKGSVGSHNALSFSVRDVTYSPRVIISHDTTTSSHLLKFDSSYSTGTGFADFAFMNGNVGIGTSSPIGKLDVSDGSNPLTIDSATYNEIQSYNRPLLLNRQGNNVGIGTSSPTGKLHVESSDASQLSLTRTGVGTFGLGVVSGDALIFQDGSTERMRIDSSGNVGIGVTDPDQKLEVNGVIKTSLGSGGLSLSGYASPDLGYFGYNYFNNNGTETVGQSARASHRMRMGNGATNAITFDYRAPNAAASTWSERMRLDSSGNLLVGKTSASGSLAGAEMRSDGYTVVTRDGATPMQVRRLTNTSGDLIEYYTASQKIGSIGFEGGDALVIQAGSSSGSGLHFHPSTAQIVPARANARIDATLDLGRSSTRFKDLYLSGGVYLGGTGSANLLDDYEEGTWTPVLRFGQQNTDFTYDVQVGKYVKIGKMVSVNWGIRVAGTNTKTGIVDLNGLPFTPSAGSYADYSSIASTLCDMPSSRTYMHNKIAGTTPKINLAALGNGSETSVNNNQWSFGDWWYGEITYYTA